MKITMINSVGDHVAGSELEVDEETGSRFVLLGYARTDEPQPAYTPEQRAEIEATSQRVSV